MVIKSMDNQREVATKLQPDSFLFIIGAMKSGTTSLFEILSQHPNICASKTKEPDYFIKDRDLGEQHEYLSLWDWHANTHRYALESSVAYTKFPHIKGVPERIKQSQLGQYRFIYMLRDPLTRIESQIRHGVFAGWGKSLDSGVPDDAINFSSYTEQLKQYLNFFPKKHILLITLEEFKLEPHETLAKICTFLNIDHNFEFSDVDKTRNSGEFFNTSATVSHITQSSFGQFLASKVLSARTKTWLRSLIARLSKKQDVSTDIGRWQLSDDERELILKTLDDDLQHLQSEFDVDIQKYWDIPADNA